MGQAQQKRQTVLIVEDDAELRSLTAALFEDEPYVTGDEGIGNRRNGPAFEISIEDRKIEVGFPRRFQRLVDARGLGGDGIAKLT